MTLILDRIVDQKILDELLGYYICLSDKIRRRERFGETKKTGKRDHCKNMFSLGIEDELVMKATGLEKSIIERLKKTLSLPMQ